MMVYACAQSRHKAPVRALQANKTAKVLCSKCANRTMAFDLNGFLKPDRPKFFLALMVFLVPFPFILSAWDYTTDTPSIIPDIAAPLLLAIAASYAVSCAISQSANLREFFRPAYSKAAAAALLLLIFVPFVVYDKGTWCSPAPCLASDTGTAFSWFFHQSSFLSLPYIYSLDTHFAMPGFTISYIIACALLHFLQPNLAKNGRKKAIS